MKIVGVIAEYNPFHKGHLYHIGKAKKQTGADAVIAVMSGDFVQRGAPALLPKHLRAAMALEAGVSLVLELPVWCACGSAEYFASGAVSVLDQLGCVDSLCFGSECGDLPSLSRAARILEEEPEDFRAALKAALSRGLSFPRARQEALVSCAGSADAGAVMEEPNNILGVEYIRAILRRGSRLEPATVRREGSGYHDQAPDPSYSSATAIRRLILEAGKDGLPAALRDQVPAPSARILAESYGSRCPVYADDFSLLLKYRLLTESAAGLASFADVTEDLANRIAGRLNGYLSFAQFCSLLKTKEMTYARISRCLLHILLGIRGTDMDAFRAAGGCGYARVLGFRRDAAPLLNLLKKTSAIPLVTKPSRASLSGCARRMFESDLYAANLYESVVTDKFRTPFIHECRQQVVIV